MNKKNFVSMFVVSLVLLTSLVAMTSFVFVPKAYAFEGRDGQTVTIGEDEVITEDLYITGEIIIVNGTIQGDLLAGGDSITINGTVEGDLWVAGRKLELNGTVGDDLFFGGAAATLGNEASVGDDLFFGGYSLETRSGSQVGGSVFMGGYQGLFSGDMAENMWLGGNRVRIEGTVGGNVTAEVADPSDGPDFSPSTFSPDMPVVPSIPAGLTLGNEAQVEGDLTYTTNSDLGIASERIRGIVEHRLPAVEAEVTARVKDTPAQMVAAWMFTNIRRLVSFIVVGLLLAWLLPVYVVQPANQLQTKPWPSLGWGLVLFVVVPFVVFIAIGIVIAFAVLMGALTLGSLLGAVLSVGGAAVITVIAVYALVLSFATKSVVAYLGGRAILNRLQPEWAQNVIWPLLLGLVILAILFAVPIFGGITEFVVMIFGLGAIFLLLRERLSPAAPAVVQAPAETE